MSFRESITLSPADLDRTRQSMRAGALMGWALALIVVSLALYELWK